jgi:hypothetical protein
MKMANPRLFTDTQHKSDPNTESALLKAYIEPKYKLIDEQLTQIMNKFQLNISIVIKVNESIQSLNSDKGRSLHLIELKSRLSTLADFINNLVIFDKGALNDGYRIKQFIVSFSNYAAYLIAIIANAENNKLIKKDTEIEKGMEDAISIFKISMATVIADVKEMYVKRYMDEYKEMLNPTPPAATPSKKRGCTIL